MHGIVVYMKEGLPLALGLSLENSADSYLCFRLALLHSASYLFFLYQSPSLSLCKVFDSISSNANQVLSINPSANMFVFEGFDVYHKDWLTYSSRTDRTGSICYNCSQTTLLRWLTFLFASQDLVLTVLLFWIYFFLLTLIFVLQWLSSFAKLWSCCCLSFHWLSIILTTDAPFHHIAYEYSRANWDSLCHHLRDVPSKDTLMLVLLLLLVNFLNEFRLEWIYLSLIKSTKLSFAHIHCF